MQSSRWPSAEEQHQLLFDPEHLAGKTMRRNSANKSDLFTLYLYKQMTLKQTLNLTAVMYTQRCRFTV